MSADAQVKVAEEWKHPEWPLTDERIKTMWCPDTREFYVAIDKYDVVPFSGHRVEMEITVLNGIGQTLNYIHVCVCMYIHVHVCVGCKTRKRILEGRKRP